MNKLFKKGIAFVLSLAMVVAFTPAFAWNASAEDEAPGYTVTKSYVKTGTEESDIDGIFADRVGTEALKVYTQEEFEALATVGDKAGGEVDYYMWTKDGANYTVDKVRKGVTYESILRDAAGIESKAAINALCGIYSYDAADLSKYYSKLKILKSAFLGGNTYGYDGAKYDSAAGAVVLGEPKEQAGVIALEYEESLGGLSEANPDLTPAELTDWVSETKDKQGNMNPCVNRAFLGLTDPVIAAGWVSQTGANIGIDIVEYYDYAVTVKDGESSEVLYLAKDETIDIPAYYEKDGKAVQATGKTAEAVAADLAVEGDAIELAKCTSLSGAKVAAIADKTYTGSAIKPAVKVTKDGKTLVNGTDYTVSYKNNTKVGKATATVKGAGAYAGTVSKTFKIVPKKAVVAKATAGKKQMTVKAKTAVSKTGGTTYQIWYKVKGASKWSKTTTTKQSKVIKKLKKGKKYQVKIRAYKKVGSDYYYGAWSAVKTSVKIK